MDRYIVDFAAFQQPILDKKRDHLFVCLGADGNVVSVTKPRRVIFALFPQDRINPGMLNLLRWTWDRDWGESGSAVAVLVRRLGECGLGLMAEVPYGAHKVERFDFE